MNDTSTRTLFFECLAASDTLVMEVRNDRMKDQGIAQGSLLVVAPRERPEPGQWAVTEENGRWELRQAKGEGKEVKVVWVVRKY